MRGEGASAAAWSRTPPTTPTPAGHVDLWRDVDEGELDVVFVWARAGVMVSTKRDDFGGRRVLACADMGGLWARVRVDRGDLDG